jgi:hypothetical protein
MWIHFRSYLVVGFQQGKAQGQDGVPKGTWVTCMPVSPACVFCGVLKSMCLLRCVESDNMVCLLRCVCGALGRTHLPARMHRVAAAATCLMCSCW